MVALVFHLSSFVALRWLWMVCLISLALIPLTEWIRRSPQRIRFTLAFVVVILGASAMAWADGVYPPGGVWDDCCQWLIPYGICWPIEWC